MKQRLALFACILCVVALCGCSAAREDTVWDCSVTCMETSDADSYVISYSDEEVVTQSGVLSFQNRNQFDITVHLLIAGKKEKVLEIPAGGVFVQYQLEADAVYTVGCHADAAKGAEISLMVYEGERADMYA